MSGTARGEIWLLGGECVYGNCADAMVYDGLRIFSDGWCGTAHFGQA
ncbi:MAG: hypothetical protein ACLR8P_05440 [Clostridium fessum]